ncbi:hypothetical protein LXL04_033153 [Taraxacum kok-saghyz]
MGNSQKVCLNSSNEVSLPSACSRRSILPPASFLVTGWCLPPARCAKSACRRQFLFHTIQPYLFSCLELTKLVLENCVFKPPIEFEGFINLTDLYLKNIGFMCGTQIILPQLGILWLDTCTNVCNFNIKATKLHNLFVSNCPDVKLLHLLHSPCITVLGTYFPNPIRDERITLEVMLSNLPKIEYLNCDCFFFKVSKHLTFASQVLIEQKIPKWLPNMVNSLKHLQVQYYHLGDLYQLHVVLCLLRNSPNLESLYVTCLKKVKQNYIYISCIMQELDAKPRFVIFYVLKND